MRLSEKGLTFTRLEFLSECREIVLLFLLKYDYEYDCKKIVFFFECLLQEQLDSQNH